MTRGRVPRASGLCGLVRLLRCREREERVELVQAIAIVCILLGFFLMKWSPLVHRISLLDQ